MLRAVLILAFVLVLSVSCGGGGAAERPPVATPATPAPAGAARPETTPTPQTTAPTTRAPSTPSRPQGEPSERPRLAIEVPFVSIAVPRLGILAATMQVAQKAELWESASLAVAMVETADTGTALQALQSGRVHLAMVTLEEAAQASQGPNAVRVIAGLFGSQPYNVVVSSSVAQRIDLRETSPLEGRLAALKGLKLGIASERLAEATAAALVRAAGHAPADVALVSMARSRLLQALKEGEVDGILASHPELEQAIVLQDARLMINLSRGEVTELEPFPWLVLATTQRMESIAPGTLTAVVYAVWNAERQVRRDPRRSSDLIAEFYKNLPAPVFEQSTRIYFPAIPNNPLLTPLSYGKVFRVLGQSPAPFLQAVENKYIEALIPRQ